jgi:hypothetical protein
MAYITDTLFTGDGVTTTFVFTFPYQNTGDVKVSINGSLTTAWSFTGTQTILFTSAPANGAVIRIYRDSVIDTLYASFSSGAAIRGNDLNENFTQNLYLMQELRDNIVRTDGLVSMKANLNMGGFKVTNLALPTAAGDAASLFYVQSVIAAGIGDGDYGDISVSSLGMSWTIDPNAVTTAKIANGAVTAAKIAADTITANEIAPNSIGASELADNAVDTNAIANGAVTAGKIATDTITANEIAPNAIGASELADNAVDTNAIVNSAVTAGKTTATPNNTASELVARSSTGNIDVTSLNTGRFGMMGRNFVINGAMNIYQRGAAATATGAFALDRWKNEISTTGAISTSQVAVTDLDPSGQPHPFHNCLRMRPTTADTSVGAAEFVVITHPIEGRVFAPAQWGTAAAKAVTLSFYIKSVATGTFGVSFINSAANRIYPATYTVNASNTWEYKTITIPGDTSGTWLTDNGLGVAIRFCFMSGSNFLTATPGSWGASNFLGPTGQANAMAAINNDVHITGVQLELGSIATTFESVPYEMELYRCFRYYQVARGLVLTTATVCTVNFPEMRAINSITTTPDAGTGGTYAALGVTSAYQDVVNSVGSGANIFLTGEL